MRRGGSCRRPCRVPARPRMSPGLNPRCPRSHPAERPSCRLVPEPVRSVGLRPAAPSWLTVLGATVPCAEPHPRALPSCCSPARPRAESQSAPRFPSLLPDGLVRPCRPHTCHQEALMAAMSSPAHALSADTAASAQPRAPEPHAADSPPPPSPSSRASVAAPGGSGPLRCSHSARDELRIASSGRAVVSKPLQDLVPMNLRDPHFASQMGPAHQPERLCPRSSPCPAPCPAASAGSWGRKRSARRPLPGRPVVSPSPS